MNEWKKKRALIHSSLQLEDHFPTNHQLSEILHDECLEKSLSSIESLIPSFWLSRSKPWAQQCLHAYSNRRNKAAIRKDGRAFFQLFLLFTSCKPHCRVQRKLNVYYVALRRREFFGWKDKLFLSSLEPRPPPASHLSRAAEGGFLREPGLRRKSWKEGKESRLAANWKVCQSSTWAAACVTGSTQLNDIWLK